ncbi:carboxymuconolactone decarboxylase family protein [Enterovirga sp. CN4-39]|uniref:carboxymuconolactone decarboxylase family protein n=1 Tax=Enterovirga sp. CN4-39 TaxID=3400910 RepID=UPI003BFEBA79
MAATPSTPVRAKLSAIVPHMIELTETVLFGDVWEREGLSKRDRSLITCAALLTAYRPDQLKGHFVRALSNGVTVDELSEMITHLAFYSGWPGSMAAAKLLLEVVEEQKAAEQPASRSKADKPG